MSAESDLQLAAQIASKVERFVRREVIPFERDQRWGAHGPSQELLEELRDRARAASLMTPHILPDGKHLTHRGTALVLQAAGLSLLGPVALNVSAPDEGNMFLLGRVATTAQKERFLHPLVTGRARSAFFMTEPALEGGAGSDPSMLKTVARPDGDHWIISGRKAFITGADGARVGIVMAKSGDAATMFLVELPSPAMHIERVLDTIDGTMPGGHAVVNIDDLRIHHSQILGEVGQGLRYAQVRLAPARLTHCMRWLGACRRAQEFAIDYVTRRHAFGKPLIEHEGVGFMLADNDIELKQSELMIDWCAGVLDTGQHATSESSMTKVAVSEALFRIADRCVQMMGGTGVTREAIVERVFREIRAFRIYDGPSEVHRWAIARRIQREGREHKPK